MTETLPLIDGHAPDATLLWHGGQAVSAARFEAEAQALAVTLPECRYVLNLCEDRYAFMLAFAAALLRSQISLLPPNRSPDMIRQVTGEYAGAYVLHDQHDAPAGLAAVRVSVAGLPTNAAVPVSMPAQIPAAQTAVLAFTSGSTGQVKANLKTWGSLHRSTQMAAIRFLRGTDAPANLVVTVPPQHMYGLETSILLPLQANAAVYSGRPFYPDDVRAALEAVPPPRVLVTTPVHLRACVKAGISFPPVEFIISATAPLAVELAVEAEALFDAPVREIYGCTEAGQMASRRTTEGDVWQLYDGMTMTLNDDCATVTGPQLAEAVILQDVIEARGENRFALRGRNTDMVIIAGKRASLGDLNHKLLQINGVIDAVVFQPDADTGPVERLAALVVAPTLSREQIAAQLSECIDPVFLPRPLVLVKALPRNETSKLPRQALLELLRSAGR